MKILAVDTSGNACSVAVVEEKGVVAELFTDIKKNHSVMLMPMIDDLLKLSAMSLEDVEFIAVSSGPGSFTGLRIGAASVKALAHALSKKIVPVPTLDALAYNVYSNSNIIVPIMDARRSQVYTAFYRWVGDTVSPVSEYLAEDIGCVMDMLKELGETAIFTGDAVNVYSDFILERGFKIAPPGMRIQRAASVGALAFRLSESRGTVDYNDFVPVYLRRPQAEREAEEKKHE